MNRNALVVLAAVAAALVFAGFLWLTRAETPVSGEGSPPPGASTSGSPTERSGTAALSPGAAGAPGAPATLLPTPPHAPGPVGGLGLAAPGRSAPTGSGMARLSPDEVRARFAAAIAAGPASAPASGAAAQRPGETPLEYLQRLDAEARKAPQDTRSPFGGSPATGGTSAGRAP